MKYEMPGEGPVPKDEVAQPIHGSTTVQRKHGRMEDEPVTKNEIPGSVPVSGKPAVVRFEAGLTLNLGNFESAKISVGVEMPCDPKDIDAAYERGKNWVTQRLGAEVNDIRSNKTKIF